MCYQLLLPIQEIKKIMLVHAVLRQIFKSQLQIHGQKTHIFWINPKSTLVAVIVDDRLFILVLDVRGRLDMA